MEPSYHGPDKRTRQAWTLIFYCPLEGCFTQQNMLNMAICRDFLPERIMAKRDVGAWHPHQQGGKGRHQQGRKEVLCNIDPENVNDPAKPSPLSLWQ